MDEQKVKQEGEEVKGGAAPLRSAGASRPDARARTSPPGFRRLEVGEKIQEHDVVWPVRKNDLQETICAGSMVEYDDLGYYYRRLPEERQKAGLPALESAQADPEPVRAEGPSDEFLFAFNEGMKFQSGTSSYKSYREAWEAFHKGIKHG